jgi:hypothetical protein
MFLLVVAAAVGGAIFAFSTSLNVPRYPWLGEVLKIGMATIGPVGGGVFAFLVLRHLLWLFGRGSRVETWVDPPSRANCVIVMVFSLIFVGIGFEMGGALAISLSLLGSSIWFFFSLTGFLWAQAEARHS